MGYRKAKRIYTINIMRTNCHLLLLLLADVAKTLAIQLFKIFSPTDILNTLPNEKFCNPEVRTIRRDPMLLTKPGGMREAIE